MTFSSGNQSFVCVCCRTSELPKRGQGTMGGKRLPPHGISLRTCMRFSSVFIYSSAADGHPKTMMIIIMITINTTEERGQGEAECLLIPTLHLCKFICIFASVQCVMYYMSRHYMFRCLGAGHMSTPQCWWPPSHLSWQPQR